MLGLLPAVAHATPQVIRVDGSIFNNAGVPVTASKDIQIKAYDAASAGSLLWTSSVYNTAVATGRFTINLDAAAGSPSLVDRLGERTSSQAIYFQIEVDAGAANGSMDTPVAVLPRMSARGTAFALTANTADALKGVTATTAEMNYLSGISANVQSQINTLIGGGVATGRIDRTGDTMTGDLGLAGSQVAAGDRALIVDSSRRIASSSVTATQLSYLSSTTADVQTQLNAKIATTAAIAKAGDTMTGDLGLAGSQATASRALILDSNRRIASSSVTDTQLDYLSGLTTALGPNLNGLTANVQTQFNAKVSKAGDTMTGVLGLPAGTVGAPAMNLNGDASTGLYSTGNGTLNVAIAGSATVSMSSAGMTVNGQVSANQKIVASGATVDFNQGNAQVLQAPGDSAITLNNMQDGGSYTLVITDATSRTYTFTNCTNSKFIPANAPTTVSTTTVYSILKMTISAATYCYISWISGF